MLISRVVSDKHREMLTITATYIVDTIEVVVTGKRSETDNLKVFVFNATVGLLNASRLAKSYYDTN